MNNQYSAIVTLGFIVIKFLFLSIMGFGIVYIFTYTIHSDGATALLKLGSQLITPLVVLVFCIMAGVIILESCRE